MTPPPLSSPPSRPLKMNRRSRGGCIDCRRSKVKCDETRPFCGTCTRRRRVCQGYASSSSNGNSTGSGGGSSTSGHHHNHAKGRPDLRSLQHPKDEPRSPSAGSDASNQSMSDLVTLSPKCFSLIPPGVVQAADEPLIEIYFNRHPYELLIGPEFVHEMNANVLVLLHQKPKNMVDCLSGIGHMYLTDHRGGSILPVLDRRARIIANLRELKDASYDLDEISSLLLGLCAMELVGSASAVSDMVIPAIISNSASLINHHISSGREISSLAKYFIRALARQDIIISLIQLRRPMIATAVWLDDYSRTSVDRLMGYTATLMPLFEELGALAEELHVTTQPVWQIEHDFIDEGAFDPIPLLPSSEMLDLTPASLHLEVLQRAEDLRLRIQSWRPAVPQDLPFRSSRKFLSHASAYRAAALLYLYRLFKPSGSSLEADREALSMAHDILLYAGGPAEELKMFLWPIFLAACELSDEEDRSSVLNIFESISAQRKTVTAERTKAFCINRIWKARDEGMVWNWMILARQFPDECLPI